MVAFITAFESRDSVVDLLQDCLATYATARAKAPVITERTPTFGDCPVDIWAGKPRVDTNLLNAVPKNPFEMLIARVVSIPGLAPVNRRFGDIVGRV